MIYRELRPSEYELLKTFTYEAIFIPEGVELPDRSIIELPELSLYYDEFGSKTDDYCMVADDEGTVAGAAWESEKMPAVMSYQLNSDIISLY